MHARMHIYVPHNWQTLQLLWMLELYWTKALFAILQVVGCEAAFVADAEIRRRQLDMRNSNKTVRR